MLLRLCLPTVKTLYPRFKEKARRTPEKTNQISFICMNVCIHRRQHYNDNVTYRIVRISVQSFQCNYYYREDDRQRRHIITCAATADRIRSSIYSVRLAVAAAIATSQMVVFCCLLRLTISKYIYIYIYISLLPTNPKTKYAIKAVNISIMR